MFEKPTGFAQRGVISPHLLIALAVIGLIIYVLISSTFPFKDKLFGLLYPKPSSQAAGCLKMIIPAYFYPGPLWDQTISKAGAVDIMIVNPSSGPGSTIDTNYTGVINKAKAAGIKIPGYVYTDYGNRDAAVVKADIDKYRNFYGVNDIFLDQVSASTTALSYYQDLANYIRATSGSLVILNHGAIPNQAYAQIGDILLIFEGSFSEYKAATFPSWVFNYPSDKFAHLVYDTGNKSRMNQAIRLANQQNAGYIYVTNDTLPNPWDSLPSYWSAEINKLCTATPSPTPTPNPTPTASATPTPSPLPSPTSLPGGSIWKPALNTSWQWQLTGTLDTSLNVTMYDIDLFDNSASVVASLKNSGKKVICYYSAGSWENWRPDANQFPDSVKGNSNGWPGEKWLDIRRLDVLGPIMSARLDLAKQKGCDGVEPDNVDGYTNNTGFPLTYQDQINYNKWTANAAHARGLSVGLKNDIEQVNDLLSYYDWTLNEQCFQYNECDPLTKFVQAGKAVFNVEYKLDTSQFCPQANSMNFNSLKKNLDLDAYRVACR